MTGAAQAVEGVYNNAAAPAVREPFSLSFVDIDPSVGFSLPGAYGGTDFDNRGEQGNSANAQRTNRFLTYNAAICSSTSSMVMMPATRPNSSITTAKWLRLPRSRRLESDSSPKTVSWSTSKTTPSRVRTG